MSNQSTKSSTALYVLAVLFIIWGILGLMDAKNYVTSGYNTDGNNTIIKIIEGGPAEAAGLQVGDVIKSTGGIAVTDTKALNNRARAKAGETRTYVVDRNGEEVSAELTFAPMTDKNSTLNMVAFVLGLLFIICGLLTHNKVGSALSYAFAMFALCFGFIFFDGPYTAPGFLDNLLDSVDTSIVLFSFVALASFMLKYPKESSFNSKLLYAPALILIIIIWILNFVQPDGSSTLNVVMRTLFSLVILFYFGLSLITLIKKYNNTSADNRASSGLSLMLIGTIIGIVPILIVFVTRLVSPQTVLPGGEYVFITFAAIAIFFSMAVMRQNNQTITE